MLELRRRGGAPLEREALERVELRLGARGELRVGVLPRHRLDGHAVLDEVLEVGAERVEPVLQLVRAVLLQLAQPVLAPLDLRLQRLLQRAQVALQREVRRALLLARLRQRRLLLCRAARRPADRLLEPLHQPLLRHPRHQPLEHPAAHLLGLRRLPRLRLRAQRARAALRERAEAVLPRRALLHLQLLRALRLRLQRLHVGALRLQLSRQRARRQLGRRARRVHRLLHLLARLRLQLRRHHHLHRRLLRLEQRHHRVHARAHLVARRRLLLRRAPRRALLRQRAVALLELGLQQFGRLVELRRRLLSHELPPLGRLVARAVHRRLLRLRLRREVRRRPVPQLRERALRGLGVLLQLRGQRTHRHLVRRVGGALPLHRARELLLHVRPQPRHLGRRRAQLASQRRGELLDVAADGALRRRHLGARRLRRLHAARLTAHARLDLGAM